MPLPPPRSDGLSAPSVPSVPGRRRTPTAATEPHGAHGPHGSYGPHGPCRIAEGTGGGPATGSSAGPALAQGRRRPIPLAAFNALPPAQAETALLRCCGSGRWAARIAAHRPYPDGEALLAAADEASYDMAVADLDEALAGESARHPLPFFYEAVEHRQRGILAAHTALQAAHAAYQGKFGHAFLICLDGCQPAERLDRTLTEVRARLTNEAEEERAVTADELRRLARGRLARLVPSRTAGGASDRTTGETAGETAGAAGLQRGVPDA